MNSAGVVVGTEEVEVKTYNEIRGFGFVKTQTQGDAFFHIKQIRNVHKEPKIGDRFVAELERSEEGKIRVKKASAL
jgi:cold shock CspA family protein